MKVAFVLRKFPVLSETFILEQIVGLIEQGIEVDIFALFEGDCSDTHPLMESYKLLERTRFPKVPCDSRLLPRFLNFFTQLKGPKSRSVGARLRSVNFLKYRYQALFLNLFYFSGMFEERTVYDIVHCHFGMYGLIGVDLRDLGLISGKVITSFHGIDIHVYPKQYGRSVYKRLLLQGDHFTVNSDFTKDCLVKLGCPVEKISKLPVGLRTSQYAAAAPKSVDGTMKVLTVGRLVEKKGIEYGIRAIAQLYSRFPMLRYDIVGEGPLKDNLARLIESINATEYIRLLGPRNQDELRELYAESEIFLLPSVTASNGDMEGQGLVLQEAQASSIPVVSTLHNGIPEGILPDDSGFLVPERDITALATRIADLAVDPSLRKKMGLTGRKFVRDHFDISRLNVQLLDIYRDLL